MAIIDLNINGPASTANILEECWTSKDVISIGTIIDDVKATIKTDWTIEINGYCDKICIDTDQPQPQSNLRLWKNLFYDVGTQNFYQKFTLKGSCIGSQNVSETLCDIKCTNAVAVRINIKVSSETKDASTLLKFRYCEECFTLAVTRDTTCNELKRELRLKCMSESVPLDHIHLLCNNEEFYGSHTIFNRSDVNARSIIHVVTFPPLFDRDPFQIFVKTLTGGTITLTVNSRTTVTELKVLIEKKEDIPPDQQRLIYTGRQIQDEDVLTNIGIVDCSTVHLVLRTRGGMMHISSSRNDYCSTLVKSTKETKGDLLIEPKDLHIDYLNEQGQNVRIILWVHPQCGIETIKEMVQMECDVEYFKKLTREELGAIVPRGLTILSKGALSRLALALQQ